MKTAVAVGLFLQSRQAKGLSNMTIKWYRGILERFAGEYNNIPGKPEQIEKFLISLNVGDERRHGYYRALKCFYKFLERRNKFRHNPVTLIDEPVITKKDPPILMPEEINRILNISQDPKVKAALLMLTDSGPRLAEVAGLSINDLTETPEGFIAMVDGKTGQRTIPISYESYHALITQLPFGYSKDFLGRKISKICKTAGVRASAITFRHTFGTLWSGDELALQSIMGHTTLNTTRRYRHLRVNKLIQQHNQYSPLKMVLATSKSML